MKKKHELLKYAYDNYPKGTIASFNGGEERISSGKFAVDKDREYGTVVKDQESGEYFYCETDISNSKPEWISIISYQEKKEPILISEDGVKLYKGDNYHRAFFDKEWRYDYCEGLSYNDAVNRDDEFSAEAKAFSNKESALKWIEEQNEPESIFLLQDQPAKVLIGLTEDLPYQRIWEGDSGKGVLIYANKEDTAYNLTFDEIDEIHKASLKYRGLI